MFLLLAVSLVSVLTVNDMRKKNKELMEWLDEVPEYFGIDDFIATTRLEVIEIKKDDAGTFIRFLDENGDEGFILLPEQYTHTMLEYRNGIRITIENIGKG